jgi:alpha-beta hydrolase superfamily lysophospholipase/SAM-dependent methyltransferase
MNDADCTAAAPVAISDGRRRACPTTEQTFQSWDGVGLFYRAWVPLQKTDKALLLLHRGHEHSGRWQETVESLGLDDVAVFAWDQRGHGRSPGERGSANHLVDLVKDLNAFAQHISEKHGIPLENMIVLAHSLAAVIATAWVHDYAPPIRAMVLATAAFEVKLYVPFAISALRIFKPRFVKSYVKSKMLTHDAQKAAAYDADPLIFRQIAVNLLLDLHDTGKRLVADAGAIQTPTLMIGAVRDWVVSLKAQQKFFDGLSSQEKRFEIFPETYHAIFHERERGAVVDLVRNFVTEQFSKFEPRASLLNADNAGYTHDEYLRLQKNGHARFAIARTGLKIAGRLSNGIDVGWRHGFDSGLSLDYVYENKPRGRTPIGRLIDKSYLNSIGWRGIRQRRLNLEKALQRVIAKVREEKKDVRILDSAAGPGRYVLETVGRLSENSASVVLRDYKSENVEAARSLAAELSLTNVLVEQGNAFDRDSIASVSPRFTIGIVSGLYELFPSNEMVLNSLRGLADAIEPGGYFIYTNQPWHPQVEFIAHVLRNREGARWIMRRRTTAEMDELVRAAGFAKIDMEVDQWGMFTVSIARRLTSSDISFASPGIATGRSAERAG